jgi:hypothetical protein
MIAAKQSDKQNKYNRLVRDKKITGSKEGKKLLTFS